MKRIYTTGVYDILHLGHINLLQTASKKGDFLIVGVQDDESVREQKGRYPVMTCEERMEAIRVLPFVDEVISYSGTSQEPILEEIQPDVMVQGDDWMETSDRTNIVTYLKKHNIVLHLIPYTKGISSTQIKKRIQESFKTYRNDIGAIKKNIQILPLKNLKEYECPDQRRVERLVSKIKSDQIFIDPISVAFHNGTYVVIDGANRTEALRQLGAVHVLANVMQYDDLSQVELVNNAHFLNIEPQALLKLLREGGIEYIKTTKHEAEKNIANIETAAVIRAGSEYYITPKEMDIIDRISTVNNIVKSYIGNHQIKRLSEMSHDSDIHTSKIIFQRFDIQDIVKFVQEGFMLESGITWHKVHNSIIRVNLPLEFLTKDGEIDELNNRLNKFIQSKINQQGIRFYPNGIYVCDEW